MFSIAPEENQSGYQMVDLGLSVKWANMNVGAETPQDYGLYFDWGNVDGHAVDEEGNVVDGYTFNKTTYSTTLGGQFTGSELDPEHDAATVNMGDGWRMPTVVETVELVENTDHYYIGEDGSIVAKSELSSSKKLRSICFVRKGEAFDYNVRDNFIEIPFAGFCIGSLFSSAGLGGNIWSSSVYESNMEHACLIYFGSRGNIHGDSSSERSNGRSVRGVHA